MSTGGLFFKGGRQALAWLAAGLLAFAPLAQGLAAEKPAKPAASKPKEAKKPQAQPQRVNTTKASSQARTAAQRKAQAPSQRAAPAGQRTAKAKNQQAKRQPNRPPAAQTAQRRQAQGAQARQGNSKKAPVRAANAQRGQQRAAVGKGLQPPRRQASAPAARRAQAARQAPAPRPSYGQIFGLHAVEDELDLKSAVALVVDQETDEVLFSKNPEAVLPIASITKLMTALVVTEAGLPLEQMLTVAQADVDATAGSRSRLALGTRLSRGEMLHLSLMSSENRAAHVLGRTYPGGVQAFVAAMNRKARELGMHDTRYVEPTGLSSGNQSSAMDLAQLVRASMEHPIIRELSTAPQASMPVGARQVEFRNTNGLVYNPEWEIGLQKTGYIAAAGRCVVMQAELAGRKLIMVLLDSAGRYSRIGDAERLRRWVAETQMLGNSGLAEAVTTLPSLGPAPAASLVRTPQLR